MSYEYVCARCGKKKIAFHKGPRELCRSCMKSVDQLSAKLSPHVSVKPREFQQYSKDNVLQDLDWFVRRCNDIGTCGDVTVFSPGHPMFEKLAAQCTYIGRIA